MKRIVFGYKKKKTILLLLKNSSHYKNICKQPVSLINPVLILSIYWIKAWENQIEIENYKLENWNGNRL